MSTTWSTPRHVDSFVRTVVSCVIVKTKTRSKKSSSVETRTTSSACAGSATAEGEFLGLLGQREPVVRRLVHLGPVLHGATASRRVERVSAASLDQLLRALPPDLHDEIAFELAAEHRTPDSERGHSHHLRLGDVAAREHRLD